MQRVEEDYARVGDPERNENEKHIAFRDRSGTTTAFGVGEHRPGMIGPYFKVDDAVAARIVIPGYEQLPYNRRYRQIEYVVESDTDRLTSFRALFQAAHADFLRRRRSRR